VKLKPRHGHTLALHILLLLNQLLPDLLVPLPLPFFWRQVLVRSLRDMAVTAKHNHQVHAPITVGAVAKLMTEASAKSGCSYLFGIA
jgi:hypothetical protein